VAHPQDPMAQMGPVIEAPQGKLLKGLTSLERGESWLLEPKKLDDFIGNRNAVSVFEKWLLEWDSSNKKTKCALISGKNGVGKSILAELVLEKYDYHFMNLSNDDERDKKAFNTYIKPFIKTKTALNGKQKALIVSDIDASSGDYGFISALVECIKETEVPIICICDDRFCQNIKPILTCCLDVKLSIPGYDEIYKLVCKVVTLENIKIGKTSVDKLIRESNGDIRFVLNNLQLGLKSGHCMKNIKNSNIFDSKSFFVSLFNLDLFGNIKKLDDLFVTKFKELGIFDIDGNLFTYKQLQKKFSRLPNHELNGLVPKYDLFRGYFYDRNGNAIKYDTSKYDAIVSFINNYSNNQSNINQIAQIIKANLGGGSKKFNNRKTKRRKPKRKSVKRKKTKYFQTIL
jgi:DNA polymerase III delta prime subunit